MATINQQSSHRRLVLHLLHYLPVRNNDSMDVVDDIIPLYRLSASVRTDLPVTRVRIVPQDAELPFTCENGYVHFTLPELSGHQMVSLEYENSKS